MTARTHINTQERLAYAGAVLAIVRAMEIIDQTITYGGLAKAIGLWRNEPWSAWHRTQIKSFLDLADDMERKVGNPRPDFGRVVNQRTGEPGLGLTQRHRRGVSR